MELSTDRKHVHKENSAQRVETRTEVKSCVKTMPRRKVVNQVEKVMKKTKYISKTGKKQTGRINEL